MTIVEGPPCVDNTTHQNFQRGNNPRSTAPMKQRRFLTYPVHSYLLALYEINIRRSKYPTRLPSRNENFYERAAGPLGVVCSSQRLLSLSSQVEMHKAREKNLLFADDFYRCMDPRVHHQEHQPRERREQTRTAEMEECTERWLL
jgi:hypothetical protein